MNSHRMLHQEEVKSGKTIDKSSYFNNFIKAFISNHPDIRFCILTAEEKDFHSNPQQFLKFWRISKQTNIRKLQWALEKANVKATSDGVSESNNIYAVIQEEKRSSR